MTNPAGAVWASILGQRAVEDAAQVFSFGQAVSQVQSSILNDSNLLSAWSTPPAAEFGSLPSANPETNMQTTVGRANVDAAMIDFQARISRLGGGPLASAAQPAFTYQAFNQSVTPLDTLQSLGCAVSSGAGLLVQHTCPETWEQYGPNLLANSSAALDQLSALNSMFGEVARNFSSTPFPLLLDQLPASEFGATPYSQMVWPDQPRWAWANPLFPSSTAVGPQFALWPLTTVEGGGVVRLQSPQQMLDYLMSFKGVPYSLGGTTRAGIDCSGLPYVVFRKFGINIPRTTFAQWGPGPEAGQHVGTNPANWRPLDLVYFHIPRSEGGENGYANHLGVYIGHGQMLMATSSSEPCSVQNLNNGYWNANHRLIGAVRFHSDDCDDQEISLL